MPRTLPAPGMRTIPILPAAAVAALLGATAVTACGSGGSSTGARVIEVVAAENTWGSLAEQVGGTHVHVVSLVHSPSVDPHDYEPTAEDARAVAVARYVIVNGAGYDPWASRLLDANPSSDRVVLTVADLVHRRQGDNPHVWYDPTAVSRAVSQMVADLSRLDSSGDAYVQQQAAVLYRAFSRYNDLRASIRARFRGVAVGATETIFTDLAADLGLRLATPDSFMKAISQGADVTARDKAAVDALVSSRAIQVLVFNRQNSTPDVDRLVARARAEGIPVVAITETPVPATARFQDWQVAQLTALQQALQKATGT